MTEVKLVVPAEYIGVLKLFVAKNDVWYHLNGIALEIGPKESRLIATDGHRLGVFRVQSGCEVLDAPVTVIIPVELVTNIKPNKGEVTVTLYPGDKAERTITLSQGTTSATGLTIDGNYPAWRRVIPTGELSGVAAQFNPNYIGDLGKAARILRGKHALGVGIGHNGDSGALIDLYHEDFVGTLMPMRGGAPETAPSWAFGDLRADSPQAEAA